MKDNGLKTGHELVLGKSALICCTRNRPFRVEQLLAFLQRQQFLPGLVVFVDSSENLETREVCAGSTGRFRPIWLASAPGAPHQKNVGLNYLESNDFEWDRSAVFFLDDDIEPIENYFKTAIELLNQNTNVGIIGGFDVSLPEKANPSFIRRAMLLDDKSGGGSVLKSGICTTRKPTSRIEAVDWVPGGMQTYRGVAIQHHRFDGRIRIYGDEVEMQLRVSRATNFGIATSKDLAVVHHGEVSQKDNIAVQESYMDGFRWSLACNSATEVSRIAVVYTTLCLLIAETVFGFIKLSRCHVQKALGHLIFIKRLILFQEVQQFVGHKGSGPFSRSS
jgi:GT2 family glycosyltransferase